MAQIFASPLPSPWHNNLRGRPPYLRYNRMQTWRSDTNERTRIRNSLLTCIQQGRPLILASRPEKRTPKKQSSSIKQTDRAHLSSKRRREMDLETTSKLESNAKQRRQARWGTWFEVSRLIFPVPSPPSAVLFVVIFPHFLFFGFFLFFFFFFYAFRFL